MSPVPSSTIDASITSRTDDSGWVKGHPVLKSSIPTELILEAWAQGLLVGSLVILSFITLANMRRGVLLHKVSVRSSF
jgi:hypothetical protein